MATKTSIKAESAPLKNGAVFAYAAGKVKRSLYPGLYGWEVTYELSNGSIVFCSCFRGARQRYFVYLRDELPTSYLRTHREEIAGKKLRKLAFSRFGGHMHPEALKALFPTVKFSTYSQCEIDGKDFFFANHEIKPPELDDSFWEAPEKLFRFEPETCDVYTGECQNTSIAIRCMVVLSFKFTAHG